MPRPRRVVCEPTDVSSPALAPLPIGPVGRVAFLGTPDASAAVLEAMITAGVDVAHVVTRVDKRRGRGSTLVPSPVKVVATTHGIPVSHRVDDLVELDPPIDLGVVVAYGALIKPHVLERIPMVNLHFSLLPRWRGAAPVERCLLAGDTETGVCLMRLDEGLDTGDVLGVRPIAIDDSVTADDLLGRLASLGSEMLIDALRRGLPEAEPQSGVPTYAEKLQVDDRRVRWSDTAIVTSRRVRIGGAWTELDGSRVRIGSTRVTECRSSDAPGSASLNDGRLVVATGDVDLEVLSLQPEGKAMMAARDWVNGRRGRPVRFTA